MASIMPGNTLASFITKVFASGVSKAATGFSTSPEPPIFAYRCMLAFTSAEVSVLPLWNFTPPRSVKR